MPNAWFRLYSEFATDPKVQMMSEANQRRFIMVLCMRCSNDHVTLHDDEVAFQLRISNEEWAATKAIFLARDLINEDNSPTAWDKRQFVSDSSAERVARHRAKKKEACNVTVTPPDTETDTELSDAVASLVASQPATPDCPHQQIIETYHELLPSCPHVREWTAARQKLLRTRWTENAKRQSLAWWRKFFGYVAESEFLTGRGSCSPGRDPFVADLEWLVRPSNFVKVIEGRYHREAA